MPQIDISLSIKLIWIHHVSSDINKQENEKETRMKMVWKKIVPQWLNL